MMQVVGNIRFGIRVLLVLVFLVVGSVVNAQPHTVATLHPIEKHGADTVEKMILDTDIGDDIDDVYALALMVSMPNVKVLGVTTAWGQTQERAELAAKYLHVIGRDKIPVYAGRRGTAKIGRQYEWARTREANANGHSAEKPGTHKWTVQKEDAVTFLKRSFDAAPGEITLVAVGPLVNVGDLLTRYPEVKSKIKRIVIMGGSVHLGYNDQQPPVAEWNIKCDPVAARVVYTSGVPLTMAGLEATTMLKFDIERQKRLCSLGTPMTDALAALTMLWGNSVPTLFDPVAVAWAVGGKFCETEEKHVVVEADGMTRITDGVPNVTVLIHPQKDAFLDWYIQVLSGNPTLPTHP